VSVASPEAIVCNSDNGTASDIEHYFCSVCQPRPPEVALCGIRFSPDEPECLLDDCDCLRCVVCDDLVDFPCFLCGAE
jgi:hypothetical protein